MPMSHVTYVVMSHVDFMKTPKPHDLFDFYYVQNWYFQSYLVSKSEIVARAGLLIRSIRLLILISTSLFVDTGNIKGFMFQI